jgi:serine/threonine protein kinase
MKFSYPSGAKPLQGFTIKRGIGVGGFGEVYFAISDAGKEVALKKIQRNLDIELRGVRQCLNLNHVNLISLWDIKTNEQGESWVVMEYVPGVSLRDVIEAFPNGMPETEIKKWFAATASGVAYLHKHGIVHRDLKPGNIFRDDDQHIVKIGDYGLSKFIACNRKSGQTEAVGTFHYMAPEIGKGVYGKEIDVYALGIVLYEMLTGDVPFNGESSQEIIMKHLTDNVSLERIPPAFHRVTLKSLHKDPRSRYPSVQAMVKELPWRDLATNSESITAQYAMGHPSLMASSPGRSQPPVSFGTAKIAPIFVSGDAIEILREDVVFGEVQKSPSGQDFDRAIAPNPAIHKSTAPHPSTQQPLGVGAEHSSVTEDPIEVPQTTGTETRANVSRPAEPHVSQRITAVGRRAEIPPNAAINPAINPAIVDGEITRSHPLVHWWTFAPAATVSKMLLLGLAVVVILLKPALLLKCAFVGGLFYLISYVRRHGALSGRGSNRASNANTEFAAAASTRDNDAGSAAIGKTLSTFGLSSPQLTAVRTRLREHTWRERLTALLGALLIAALSCIVLNLIPFSLSAVEPSTAVEIQPWVNLWGRYALVTTVSVCACWIILAGGKLWELSSGEAWPRRAALVVIGLAIGTTGWAAAEFFGIPLSSPNGLHSLELREFQIGGIPVIAAYLIFFMVFFGALRWWYQVDPLRKTRLSLWTVGLCFIWAVVLSHVLGRSVITHGLFAIVVSTSLQLSAPWIGERQRKTIVAAGR